MQIIALVILILAGKKWAEHDHKHRFKTIRPYDYKDAASLLADFWKEVDDVLAEKRGKPWQF